MKAHCILLAERETPALSASLKWAGKLIEKERAAGVSVLCPAGSEPSVSAAYGNLARVKAVESWTNSAVIGAIASEAEEAGADCALVAFSCCPFLNIGLAEKVLEAHEKYVAEFTFADGYPAGLAPVALDAGAAKIIAGLCAQEGRAPVPVREGFVFESIKADINSFEVETVISAFDYRQYRLRLFDDCKADAAACDALKEAAEADADALCALAAKSAGVLCTVPRFYNIQIASPCRADERLTPYPAQAQKKWPNPAFMEFDKFSALARKAAQFSGPAVLSLSAWGEPLSHPDFLRFAGEALGIEGMSLLVETDGLHFSEEIVSGLRGLKERAESASPCAPYPKIIWILTENYDMTQTLVEVFGPCVYPQLVRTKESEPGLEKFYRFWHDKGSPSRGNLIIQKYDHFCGTQADLKPADLSPLVRRPCWHLRRDMNILLDGGVCACRERVLEAGLGNAFDEDLDGIWRKSRALLERHVCADYEGPCGNCDEYYTFNF